MKRIYAIATTLIVCLSACQFKPAAKQDQNLKDTIETASGLKYFYLKRGDGRHIEKGAKVGTYLSLKVDDKVVWNTDELPDSLFTFVADYSRLIKGFTEMSLLLREGDEVVAILPSAIAYGTKGAGAIIPPNATLVYDHFKVVSVETPKTCLSDTLYAVFKADGMESMLNTYHQIVSGDEADQYHTDEEQLVRVWYQLTGDSLYQQAAHYAMKMGEAVNSPYLKLKGVESLEKSGKKAQALEIIKHLLTADPENEELAAKLEKLEAEL